VRLRLATVSLFVLTTLFGVAAAGTAASSIPNGTYRTSFTAKQLAGPGIGPAEQVGNLGTWTLTLKNGRWKLVDIRAAKYGRGDHITGTYSGPDHVVTFLHKTPRAYAGVAPKVRWSFDGRALHFKPISGFPAPAVKAVWTKHAWVKVRS
jgi:hypothetical protein